MRFASLGSGSRGNALVVAAGETQLLVDCGFSLRSTIARLSRLAVLPEAISGILVTHEHGDHVSGIRRFAARFGIPVYLSHGTFVALGGENGEPSVDFRLIDASDGAFLVGDIEITAFTVPHDAREPVQYVLGDGDYRLGVLTDCGSITPHIVETIDGCDALVLECNHDRELLATSDYPPMLKRRISGDFGHLGNAQAASLLEQIDRKRLQHVIAAHLSEQNNRPDLAAAALARILGCEERWIGVASQDDGFDWRELRPAW